VKSLSAVIAAIAVCVLAMPAGASAALPPIRHVFVIVLENKAFADTFGPSGQINAPYLNGTLVPKGELLTQYYGIGHNSADNYIAMISGQPPTPASKNDCPDPLQPIADQAVGPYGIAKSDGCDYPPRFKTIGDQLTARGLTWKGYNSGIPSPCSPLHDNPAPGTHYARKHNPWVFFRSLRDSGQCQANDVGLDELSTDLQSVDTTPNLSYIVPDQCEDAHDDCTGPIGDPLSGDQFALQQADAFLAKWVPQILASPAYRQDGLLIVNFDESVGDSSACCNEQPGPADPAPGGYAGGVPGAGGGVTGAVLLSKWISPGSAQATGRHLNSNPYNHYSLLRSIEDLFSLDHLGYAADPALPAFDKVVYNGG
jgi:phosphatidylinositol-3-phosphatase